MANELPELGSYTDNIFSSADEDKISKQILYQVNKNPLVVKDSEIDDYLSHLGRRLMNGTSLANKNTKFFILNDSTINAFATLGGVIGVHTGLFLAANTESELASVLGHEIAHLTQKHLPRIIAKQKRDSYKTTLALAFALLVSRSNPDLAAASSTVANASAVQNTLDFTRKHEQEADREGIKILDRAGFDVRASIDFFKTMQKGNQFSQGAAPAFLRTHPVTTDRISDIQDRLSEYPYKQRLDSDNFYYVKGKIRAFLEQKNTIIKILETNIKNKSYINESGERFALAYAYLRNNMINKARNELQIIKKKKAPNPMLLNLEAIILIQEGKKNEATKLYKKGLTMFPSHRAFVYGLAEHYIRSSKTTIAIDLLNEYLLIYPEDPNLYELMAKAQAGEGKVLLQHENLAESFYYRYNIKEAITLLDLAVRAKDGNFYEKSRVESRLKELKREWALFSKGL
ncbi:MAG: M48 family metalloprotease [Methylophilaceae bacterium]|nr:M48 family metalloprotease [Methylophilaceae bacterium]